MTHILVADDNPINLRIATRILKNSNCTGVLTRDGNECIKAFKSQKFDALIIDITMPNKNGWDVLKEIRAIDSKIPIAVLSAFDTTEDMHLAKKLGASIYIIKPLTEEIWLNFSKTFIKS